MKPERVFRQIPRSDEQRRQHAEIRERFQRDKPTREELLAQGDLVERGTMGEYLDSIAAAAALRKLREKAGLSTAAVAQASGMDQADIEAVERGKWEGHLELSTLYKYAQAVGADFQFVVQPNGT